MKISALSELDDGWDGYGAAGISQRVVSNARGLLWNGLQKGFIPDAVPTVEGTLEFEWAAGSVAASLEVGETTYSMTWSSDDSVPVRHHGDVRDGMSSPLWDFLSKHFSGYGSSVDRFGHRA